MRRWAGIGLSVGFLACHPDPPPTAFQPELSWTPCTLEVRDCELDGTTCPAPAVSDAECAQVKVPKRWASPERGTLTVSLRRRLATAPRRGQLWLLMGGPGGSVTRFGQAERYLRQSDLDLYLLEHRGVGLSSRLTCAGAEAVSSEAGARVTPGEVPSCLRELVAAHGDLDAFRVSEAARDVGELVAATATGDDQVFVYGVSYGTYWLHRYAALYPEQAHGLIFDSICSPGSCSLERYEVNHDAVGKAVLAQCERDARCASYLPQPVAALASLLDAVEQGHCPAISGGSREAVRSSLGNLLQIRDLQAAVPAVIHRMRRCASADVAALTQFSRVVAPLFGSTRLSRLESLETLGKHIVLSELFAPLDANLTAATRAALFTSGRLEHLLGSRDLWPRYDPGPDVNLRSPRRGPVLMLQGDMDPQTPPEMAEGLRQLFSRPGQSYVLVPHADHNVVFSSTYGESFATWVTPQRETCGSDVLAQFTRDPSLPLDTSCTGQMRPLSFSGPSVLSNALFGTPDFWD